MRGKITKQPSWIRETHLFRPDVYICSYCGCRSSEALTVCPKCRLLMAGTDYEPDWVDEMEMMDILFDDD